MIRLLILIFCLGLFSAQEARAQMDPRLKVLLTTAGYGTVGGALLGTASLAFGGKSRAIFQGASLGLYAGLIFGGYIIYTHHSRRSGGNGDGLYPDNPDNPYYDEPPSYYDDADQGYYDQNGGGFGALEWHYLENPVNEILNSEKKADLFKVEIPILAWTF